MSDFMVSTLIQKHVYCKKKSIACLVTVHIIYDCIAFIFRILLGLIQNVVSFLHRSLLPLKSSVRRSLLLWNSFPIWATATSVTLMLQSPSWESLTDFLIFWTLEFPVLRASKLRWQRATLPAGIGISSKFVNIFCLWRPLTDYPLSGQSTTPALLDSFFVSNPFWASAENCFFTHHTPSDTYWPTSSAKTTWNFSSMLSEALLVGTTTRQPKTFHTFFAVFWHTLEFVLILLEIVPISLKNQRRVSTSSNIFPIRQNSTPTPNSSKMLSLTSVALSCGRSWSTKPVHFAALPSLTHLRGKISFSTIAIFFA